jgi:hypothetical protein
MKRMARYIAWSRITMKFAQKCGGCWKCGIPVWVGKVGETGTTGTTGATGTAGAIGKAGETGTTGATGVN